jgi:hypothetical protein
MRTAPLHKQRIFSYRSFGSAPSRPRGVRHVFATIVPQWNFGCVSARGACRCANRRRCADPAAPSSSRREKAAGAERSRLGFWPLDVGFPSGHIHMGAWPMDSQQAWFSLPTASMGPRSRSMDANARWLGALKRRLRLRHLGWRWRLPEPRCVIEPGPQYRFDDALLGQR